MSAPAIVQVKAIDAVPYKFALWCSVGGGEPFANTIVMREACEDGTIRLMLDTHNLLRVKAYDVLDVVAEDPGHTAAFAAKLAEDDARRMRPISDLPLFDREWAL
jgi:hypothetical protein